MHQFKGIYSLSVAIPSKRDEQRYLITKHNYLKCHKIPWTGYLVTTKVMDLSRLSGAEAIMAKRGMHQRIMMLHVLNKFHEITIVDNLIIVR